MGLIEIIGLIFGGSIVTGLGSFLTLRATRTKANAEADKQVSDNWREYAERLDTKQQMTEAKVERLEGKVSVLMEAGLSSYQCPILSKHPEATCPVQSAISKIKKDEHNEEDNDPC